MHRILFLLLLFGASWISCQPLPPTPPGPPTLPGTATTPTPTPTPTTPAVIGFDAQIYEVRPVTGENIAQVQVNVLKQGTTNTPITVSYRFLDGTAHHTPLQTSLNDNYMAGDGILSFQSIQTSLPIPFFVMPTSSTEITYFTLNLYNLTGNAVLSGTTASALVYLNVNTSDPNVVLPQPAGQSTSAPTSQPTLQVTPTPTTVAPTTTSITPTPTITPTLTPTPTVSATPLPHTNTTTNEPPIVTSASSSHHDRDLGLGIGLGIGIPMICLLMFLILWCIRRTQYTPVSVVEPKPTSSNIIYVQGKNMENETKQANRNPSGIKNNAFIANPPQVLSQQPTNSNKNLHVTFDTPASISTSPESNIPHFHTTLPSNSNNGVTSTTNPLPRLHDDDSDSSMNPHVDQMNDMIITPTPTPTELPISSIQSTGPSSSYLRDTITPLHPVQPSVAERIHEMERQISFKQQQGHDDDDDMDMKHNPHHASMPPLETDDHMTLNTVTLPTPTSPPHRILTPELLSQVQIKNMHAIL